MTLEEYLEEYDNFVQGWQRYHTVFGMRDEDGLMKIRVVAPQLSPKDKVRAHQYVVKDNNLEEITDEEQKLKWSQC